MVDNEEIVVSLEDGVDTEDCSDLEKKEEKKNENSIQRLHDRPRLYSFLRSRRKPQRGELKEIKLPEKKRGEEEEDYANRCYKEVGVKPIMTGPLKMPKPNKPCPCEAKYEEGSKKGQTKIFKRCCGRGI